MQNIIAIIGLGYVGLPLAIEFAKKYKVLGYDIDKSRIKDLFKFNDKTTETNISDLKSLIKKEISDLNDHGLYLTSTLNEIAIANRYIITVPTPINKNLEPDLSYLISASKSISSILKKGDFVIYESTVFPGCTEEECVPILESESGLKYNRDFFCGYSPERVSPGVSSIKLTNIKKVTSGSNEDVAKEIDFLYSSIIEAGTHLAPSIKVAEASKSIENAQRDLNISFVNELALIFDKMGIDTQDVLEAAKTKWNFIPFSPGLVGGHCISVDPYYLVYKSKKLGYKPSVILSGREVNNSMGVFIASKVCDLLLNKNIVISKSRVLILGVTFKENCPDIRNTQVIDIYNTLTQLALKVDVYDPVANKLEVKAKLNINLVENYNDKYTLIILAVSHKEFKLINFKKLKKEGAIIYDVKSFIKKEYIDARL
tara:strand:+ start:2122 stop:3405 length:1284 start_codon:yes stop_codon:yes gene_type:complete